MVSLEDLKEVFGKVERFCPHADVHTEGVNHDVEQPTEDGARPKNVRLRVEKILKGQGWVGNIWAYLVPTAEEPFRLVFWGIRFRGVSVSRDFREDWNVHGHILSHRNRHNGIAFQHIRTAEQLKSICLYYFILKNALDTKDLGDYIEVLVQNLCSISHEAEHGPPIPAKGQASKASKQSQTRKEPVPTGLQSFFERVKQNDLPENRQTAELKDVEMEDIVDEKYPRIKMETETPQTTPKSSIFERPPRTPSAGNVTPRRQGLLRQTLLPQATIQGALCTRQFPKSPQVPQATLLSFKNKWDVYEKAETGMVKNDNDMMRKQAEISSLKEEEQEIEETLHKLREKMKKEEAVYTAGSSKRQTLKDKKDSALADIRTILGGMSDAELARVYSECPDIMREMDDMTYSQLN